MVPAFAWAVYWTRTSLTFYTAAALVFHANFG